MTHTVDSLMALHDKAVDEAIKYDEMCFNDYDIQPVLDASEALRTALTEALGFRQDWVDFENGRECGRLEVAQPVQVPLTDKKISKLWSDAHNDTSDLMAFQVLAKLVERSHGIETD
jgi:hypothetical protein